MQMIDEKKEKLDSLPKEKDKEKPLSDVKTKDYVPKNREAPRRGRRRLKRAAGDEFEQKIIDIRRVTRVIAGGRRFSFSVAIVVGDRKGSVGVGLGKASDTRLAIEKAANNARKNMIKLELTKSFSIPYESMAKFCAALVHIKPARGRRLVAGSSARVVLDLSGVKDVSAKIITRSKNKLNIAKATILALSKFRA